MTDDIVARLRALASEFHQHRPHYSEAAEEIEQLRAENERLLQEVSDLDNRMLEYEIERLRASPPSGVSPFDLNDPRPLWEQGLAPPGAK